MGRYDGLVVFVPGAAPQEKVRARVTQRKPRFWEAELVEVLEPSPFGVIHHVLSPIVARCSWQHVTHAAQIEQKKKFSRIACAD